MNFQTVNHLNVIYVDAGLFSATWKCEGKTTDCAKNGEARAGNSKQILAILAQNQKK